MQIIIIITHQTTSGEAMCAAPKPQHQDKQRIGWMTPNNWKSHNCSATLKANTTQGDQQDHCRRCNQGSRRLAAALSAAVSGSYSVPASSW
jgi:hypothetical protein